MDPTPVAAVARERFASRLERFGVRLKWLPTLKIQFILMAVVTGVLAAACTAQLMLSKTESSIEQLILQTAVEDREKTAALLSGKLQILQSVLTDVVRHTGQSHWSDAASMAEHLAEDHALHVLFDVVFAVAPDGKMLARLEKGRPSTELPNVADREYFRRVMQTDQPVVSEPLFGKVSGAPLLVIAVPVLSADRRVIGAIGGTLLLDSTVLFADLHAAAATTGASELVMDRSGVILSHSDRSRRMGRAVDQPGLQASVDEWLSSGSPIDTRGQGSRDGGFLVSRAGIALSDWTLVRTTPESVAMAPVVAARRTAWSSAALVGVLAALLAAAMTGYISRPISQLKRRAEELLDDRDGPGEPWPVALGEIGDLSRAFQHVVELRSRQQIEVQALLSQLEAVLDHAEIGITLTRDGRFDLVSRHFCHIFRCEKHDAVGQPTRMIYASDDAYAALAARARPSFVEHGTFNGELKLMRRTGQEFWARMRGRAISPGDQSAGTIWTIEDITVEREHRDHLTYSANHDALTGLANRAAFERALEDATVASRSAPFSALFIDLDRFKQVNDSGGHAAGDALLRDVAHQISSNLRGSDLVARLGGDEFAVLLRGCPEARALELAETLRTAVLEYRLQWDGQSFGVGASVGLVVVSGNYASAADVLRAADSACYAAKRQGRNCVAVYPTPSDQLVAAFH